MESFVSQPAWDFANGAWRHASLDIRLLLRSMQMVEQMYPQGFRKQWRQPTFFAGRWLIKAPPCTMVEQVTFFIPPVSYNIVGTKISWRKSHLFQIETIVFQLMLPPPSLKLSRASFAFHSDLSLCFERSIWIRRAASSFSFQSLSDIAVAELFSEWAPSEKGFFEYLLVLSDFYYWNSRWFLLGGRGAKHLATAASECDASL